jgi:hypothetical protein
MQLLDKKSCHGLIELLNVVFYRKMVGCVLRAFANSGNYNRTGVLGSTCDVGIFYYFQNKVLRYLM